jgi:hypothetical protein
MGYSRKKIGGSLMQGYCVKCHTKRELKNAKSVTMKNGKLATQGVCPVCGTKMYRIGDSGDRVIRVLTTAVGKSRLADVPADKVFRCHDGRMMKNLEELGVALRQMSEETFRYHVNDGRNDFSKWVEDVIRDFELSSGLKDSSTRSQAGKAVADRIVWLKRQVGNTTR